MRITFLRIRTNKPYDIRVETMPSRPMLTMLYNVLGLASKIIFQKSPYPFLRGSPISPSSPSWPSLIRCYGGGMFKFKIKDVVDDWTKLLTNAGVEDPKSSVEHIVAHALNSRKISYVYRSSDKFLSSEQVDAIVKMCKLRLKKMPIQYVLGEWDFRNLTLKMRRPVFIPRPETETLVDLVSKEIVEKTPRDILELCCGSGAVSVALLTAHENLRAVAVDKSAEACELAEENAKMHDLQNRIKIVHREIGEGNVSNFLNEKFDVIVSNPPYVPSHQLVDLQPEISQYEDLNALDGGKDGLNVIKLVLRVAAYLLNERGKVFLEVDPSHPRPLKVWVEDNRDLRLSISAVHKDLRNYDRFVEIVKNK